MWNEPNVYDIEFAYATEDLSFWATLLDSRSTARVLELACGTGRVLLHLVKHCHDREREVEFVGLDVSSYIFEYSENENQWYACVVAGKNFLHRS